MLFVFYEDLIADLESSLRMISNFLEKPLNDSDLPRLMEHLSFDNFKKNRAVNSSNLQDKDIFDKTAPDFIRKGKVDKNTEVTSSMEKQINDMMVRHGLDLIFEGRQNH